MGSAKRWQKRGRHAKVCCGRTSPYTGRASCVFASGERSGGGPSRSPLRTYPSLAAASTWRQARAGGGGFLPRPSARVGILDTLPLDTLALEQPGDEVAQTVWRSL